MGEIELKITDHGKIECDLKLPPGNYSEDDIKSISSKISARITEECWMPVGPNSSIELSDRISACLIECIRDLRIDNLLA